MFCEFFLVQWLMDDVIQTVHHLKWTSLPWLMRHSQTLICRWIAMKTFFWLAVTHWSKQTRVHNFILVHQSGFQCCQSRGFTTLLLHDKYWLCLLWCWCNCLRTWVQRKMWAHQHQCMTHPHQVQAAQYNRPVHRLTIFCIEQRPLMATRRMSTTNSRSCG